MRVARIGVENLCENSALDWSRPCGRFLEGVAICCSRTYNALQGILSSALPIATGDRPFILAPHITEYTDLFADVPSREGRSVWLA